MRPEVAAVIDRIKDERKELGKVRASLAGTLWSGQLSKHEETVLRQFCAAYEFDAARKEVVILGGQPYPQVFALMRKVRLESDFSHLVERAIMPDDTLYDWARARPGPVPKDECYWLTEVHMKNPVAWDLVAKGKDVPAGVPLFRVYMGLGRAHPDTIQMKTMKANVLEMAQSRARGRALRMALDIVQPTLEEMATDELNFQNVMDAEFVVKSPEAVAVGAGELGDGERPDAYPASASRRTPPSEPQVTDVAEDDPPRVAKAKPKSGKKTGAFGTRNSKAAEPAHRDALDSAVTEKGLTTDDALHFAHATLPEAEFADLDALTDEQRDAVAVAIHEQF